MLNKLMSMYAVYIIYFLGVGMTSSGIVLMPFNAFRYSLILLLGLLLFCVGSFINEFVIDRKPASLKIVGKLVFISLTLAIGVGMISGGISHFKESPTYASYLIPIGIVVSFVSFTIKNGYVLTKRELQRAGVAVVAVGLLVHSGLAYGSKQYVAQGAGHGGDVFAQECPMLSDGGHSGGAH